MDNLNFSFPGFSYQEKFDNMDVDSDDKMNFSALNLNIFRMSDTDNLNVNSENNNNFNFSPPKKKNTIDISYSIEQTFCENSNINILEEFQTIEDTCNNDIKYRFKNWKRKPKSVY